MQFSLINYMITALPIYVNPLYLPLWRVYDTLYEFKLQ